MACVSDICRCQDEMCPADARRECSSHVAMPAEPTAAAVPSPSAAVHAAAAVPAATATVPAPTAAVLSPTAAVLAPTAAVPATSAAVSAATAAAPTAALLSPVVAAHAPTAAEPAPTAPVPAATATMTLNREADNDQEQKQPGVQIGEVVQNHAVPPGMAADHVQGQDRLVENVGRYYWEAPLSVQKQLLITGLSIPGLHIGAPPEDCCLWCHVFPPSIAGVVHALNP